MEFESKILSRQIGDILYDSGFTVGTAESCTGGRVGEALIAIPGASNYFKGGIISYTNEVKETLLDVSHDTLEEQTAVCEDVARQMVKGAIKTLGVDFAVSVTGTAGPGGGTPAIPVGTIWIGCGTADDVRTLQLTEDFGRDINLAIATNRALRMLLNTVQEKVATTEENENA